MQIRDLFKFSRYRVTPDGKLHGDPEVCSQPNAKSGTKRMDPGGQCRIRNWISAAGDRVDEKAVHS